MTDDRVQAAPRKFRKKPVVIEAVRLEHTNVSDVFSWMELPVPSGDLTKALGILVPTLEGKLTARFGDWIIKGVKGEFYPCKPDIFEATYEPAD